MTTRPFGLAPLGFLDVAPPDFVALAAEAGFSSVAIRARPAVPGGEAFPLHADAVLLRETRRRIAETGVKVTAVEQVSLTRDIDIASLGPFLDAAAEVGATQIVCSGDVEDIAVVTDLFGALCEASAERGLSPCLEFMPFRALKTLGEAVQVIRGSGAENGLICMDALHLFRSGGSLEELRALDPALVGSIQLCDAPLAPPPTELLAQEARERRVLPGTGELPLAEMLTILPNEKPLDAEVPLVSAYPDDTPLQRAVRIHEAMATLLAGAR